MFPSGDTNDVPIKMLNGAPVKKTDISEVKYKFSVKMQLKKSTNKARF